MSTRRSDPILRAACGLVALLALTAGAGCTTIAVSFGVDPDVSLLERHLEIGVSTQEDVERMLGRKRTDGGIMLPVDDRAKDVWLYYYESGSAQVGLLHLIDDFDSKRIFLFVMFDEGVYDGYLWFSSLPGTQRLVEDQ